MSVNQKLERLEKRFLRADTKSLIDAACVEGSILLMEMISQGTIASNEAFDQLIIAAKGLDPALAEFAQVALFKQFAFFESSDRNVLALKTLSSQNGVTIRSPKDGSEREQSERLAAFCIELMEVEDQIEPQPKDKSVSAVREIVNKTRKKKLSQPEKGKKIASQVDDELWKAYLQARGLKTKDKTAHFTRLIQDCDSKGAPQWLKG